MEKIMLNPGSKWIANIHIKVNIREVLLQAYTLSFFGLIDYMSELN
jgi:hypothetical protein